MEFKKYLKSSVKDIEREVVKILAVELKRAAKTDKKLIPLVQAFIKACQGGKRIRGVLARLGYQLAGNKAQEINKISAAVEICHTAILAHDDIIDQDTLRRGQPSLYMALGGGHYGISQTISLGDYGLFLAFRLICQSNFPQDRIIETLKVFSQTMMDTGFGQMLDLEETDPFIVMKLKTARYTVSGPLQMGAILGGADRKMIEVMGQFGKNLGIAFQIRDDILDLEVSDKIGVIQAKKEAEKYKRQALKVLPRITKDKVMSTLLQQLAEWLIGRNS